MVPLAIEHLHVEYVMKRTQTRLVALDDVSFYVQPGELLAIVGPSGCGKTTLLDAVAGLTPFQAGRITIDGHPVRGPGQDCGMVFQSPALLPWRTVRGNIAYGLELRGSAARTAQQIAEEYLALVGLRDFSESYPHELSGGMQQRVNLARALAVRPRILLFDEPLAALDAQTRDSMQWEIQRLWQQEQTTALYVTHQISEALFLADRVLVLSGRPGRLIEIVRVNQPRPRQFRTRRDPQFMELEDHIWDLLNARSPLPPPGN